MFVISGVEKGKVFVRMFRGGVNLVMVLGVGWLFKVRNVGWDDLCK